MPPQFVSGSPLLEAAWAVGILLVSALIAGLIILGMRRVQRRIKKRVKKPTLFPQLLASLSQPLFLLIVSQGLLLALSSLSYLVTWRAGLGKVSIALAIILATYALTRIGGVLLVWYLRRAKVRQSLVRLTRRITILLVYVGGWLAGAAGLPGNFYHPDDSRIGTWRSGSSFSPSAYSQ